MAQNVTLYNLLISCPGDIKEEVTLIESAVDEFNELYAETLGITIKTRHWSKSSYAQSGGKPQALLMSMVLEQKKKLKLCFNLENKCLCIFRISLSHHQK